jgi:hypothetical protein
MMLIPASPFECTAGGCFSSFCFPSYASMDLFTGSTIRFFHFPEPAHTTSQPSLQTISSDVLTQTIGDLQPIKRSRIVR